MNPVSVDMADILESSNVGVGDFAGTSGWSIHVGEMPDTPDTCILISDTGGSRPEPNYTYERPTFQVLVRGAVGDYLTAYAKIVECRDALHGLTNDTWNSARYIQILATSDILAIGRDTKRRQLFSVNFQAHRTGV